MAFHKFKVRIFESKKIFIGILQWIHMLFGVNKNKHGYLHGIFNTQPLDGDKKEKTEFCNHSLNEDFHPAITVDLWNHLVCFSSQSKLRLKIYETSIYYASDQ